MNPEQESSGLSRRELMKRSAMVGGTIWVAPAVSTLTAGRAWAVDYEEKPPPEDGCFITGGGRFQAFPSETATTGFEANLGQGAIRCDPEDSRRPRIEINWPNGAGGTNNFKAQRLLEVTCDFQDGNQCTGCATGTAEGTLNQQGGYTLTFEVCDRGEPGTSDTVLFVITGPNGTVLTTKTSTTLLDGNIQAHCRCLD